MVKTVYASSASITADTTAVISLVTTRIESHDLLWDNILFPQMEISTQNWSEATVLDMPFPIVWDTIVWYLATSNKTVTITAWYIWYLEDI